MKLLHECITDLKMARQGASLQNYNNELVKSLEDLCKRRHALQVQNYYQEGFEAQYIS